MSGPLVSILIPHYQTESLARLCLRSIRKYTADVPHEVIVVDNASADGESLAYLRSVAWIRLIERPPEEVHPEGPWAHREALDIAVGASRGPLVLSFHTDTIPLRPGWLGWLVGQIEADDRIAAVGTHKLEPPRPLKRLEAWVRKTFLPKAASGERYREFIRSHCALYRRDVLEKLGLRFLTDAVVTTGRDIHVGLAEHGYEARLLAVREMMRWVSHLNHGTIALVADRGGSRKTRVRGARRIERFLRRPEVRAVYEDESLDRA